MSAPPKFALLAAAFLVGAAIGHFVYGHAYNVGYRSAALRQLSYEQCMALDPSAMTLDDTAYCIGVLIERGRAK